MKTTRSGSFALLLTCCVVLVAMPACSPDGQASPTDLADVPQTAEPNPRLVEIRDAVLAGEAAPLGDSVSVFAKEAVFASADSIVLDKARFNIPADDTFAEDAAATGREIVAIEKVKIYAVDAGLAVALAPAPDTPWRDVVVVFDALSKSVAEVGLRKP